MAWSTVCKLLQKQAHDILSQRYGTLMVLVCCSLLLISVIQFGEVFLEWSTEKYAAVFNSYSDNVAGKSFRTRLCLPVPIDVVYTWVNGTDPSLLEDLGKHKQLLESKLNNSIPEKNSSHCSFGNCVPALAVILDPSLPQGLSPETLGILYPALKPAIKVLDIDAAQANGKNRSVVFFSSQEEVDAVLQETIVRDGANISVRQAFYTTEWMLPNAKILLDTVMLSGIPEGSNKEKVMEALPVKYKSFITQMELHIDKGIAVVTLSGREESDQLSQESNVTLDGKALSLHTACILWDTHDYSKNEDVSASRFEDNEELRYSLRSIEAHAPWVRHVYLVTNGQIPGWLNLDSPRLTIITHEELFPNRSHLPTFSSPAIETHLHRIPGLSDHFLYLNDDVMFGRDVWPDDFFTHARGQKVYLTWPVPNCQEGCPASWIRDGYCDKACNNSECEWDGGDCTGANVQQGAGFGGGANQWQPIGSNELLYCNTGCANNWLADKYCDQSCNVLQCAFDAGDCGTDNYNQLHSIPMQMDTHEYSLPPGEFMAYINLTALFGGEVTISEGTYDENEAVRSVAIAQKFSVVTIVLQKNLSSILLNISLKGSRDGGQNVEFNCSLKANTVVVPTQAPLAEVNDTKKDEAPEVKEDKLAPVVFEDIPLQLREPQPKEQSPVPVLNPDPRANLSLYDLPPDLEAEYFDLLEHQRKGLYTEIGFQIQYKVLWRKFLDFVKTKQNSDLESQKKHHPNNASLKVESHPEDMKDSKFDTYLQGKVQKRESANDSQAYMTGLHKVRTLNGVEDQPGFLPWERKGYFNVVQKRAAAAERQAAFQVEPFQRRRLLDTFGDSLRHVNRLYNKAFGYSARKVPAHMPHLINKNIMAEMQAKFPEEWDATSSHRIRSSDDMQYAFAYFYYLMGEKRETSVDDVFDAMDLDHSGVLSDREIRTLATRLYELPLDLQTLTGLEAKFINCSQHITDTGNYKTEKYYDEKMPQVTKLLVKNCGPVKELMLKAFKGDTKYQFEIVGEEEIAFKMIRTNVSQVVGQLDDIRKNPKKFVCLNDNIDHSKEEAKTVKAVLQDFYESLFPVPSSFELPREYRNRFLHVDELRNWRKYRDWLKWWTQLALFFLIIFTLSSFFSEKIDSLKKRFSRRRPPSEPSRLETV